jgi:hypothetical protein
MEKGNFENSWVNAFEGAEVAPSGTVWTNVELELERAAGGKMKQRLLFYKLLAAASLVFAMGIAGVYYLTSDTDTTTPSIAQVDHSGVGKDIAADEQESIAPAELKDKELMDSAESSIRSVDNTSPVAELAESSSEYVSQKSLRKESANATNVNVPVPSTTEGNTGLTPSENIVNVTRESYTVYESPFIARPRTRLVSDPKQPVLEIPGKVSTADPGMVLLAQLRDEERKYQEKEKKSSTENLWTSVGFGAGSFNPNATNATFMQSSFGSSSAYASNATSGSSYSLGVQVGGRITNRLVLLGGVAYLTQNASYTSNIASLEATTMKASLNDLAYNGSTQAVTTSPYDVNSNLQYISLPVQAGYVLVDRKFALQLNGGVATDFFLLNTLTPDTDNVSKVSQGPGDESPYRTVMFSGLVGTEFSYRFSDRYRIAVNPGMRYALNSIYKAEVSTEVSPITYDVALRFRYIFR